MPPCASSPVAVKTMDSQAAWEDDHGQRDLNFGGAVPCEDEDEGFRRKASSRDPMSHRIIEKRRRDRMNSCLADLSRLIPADYLKRGRGRIEKTEIIEMAIRHMRHLQESQAFLHQTPPPSSSSSSPGSTSSSSSSSSSSSLSSGTNTSNCQQEVTYSTEENDYGKTNTLVGVGNVEETSEQYRLGFHECLSETLHFLVEIEGFPASGHLCLSLGAHLRGQYASLFKEGDQPQSPKADYRAENGAPSNCATSLQGKRDVLGYEHPGVEKINNLPFMSEIKLTSHFQASEEESEPILYQAVHGDYEAPETNSCLQEEMTKKEESEYISEPLSNLKSKENCHSYKFKSNIKRRFTAGLEKKTEEDGSEDKKYCRNALLTCMSQCDSPAAPSCSVMVNQTSLNRNDDTVPSRVPVFALHCERSFYVPLMLEPHVLSQHASLLCSPASALHPVTISVNFCNGRDESSSDKCNSNCMLTSRDLPVTSSHLSMSTNNLKFRKPCDSYSSL